MRGYHAVDLSRKMTPCMTNGMLRRTRRPSAPTGPISRRLR
jgi:hypothetical protein